MRMPRTRTLIATAAVAAATATAGFMIASTAGASTTTTAGTLTAATGKTGTIAVHHGEPVHDRGRPAGHHQRHAARPTAARPPTGWSSSTRYNDQAEEVAARQDQADQQGRRGHVHRPPAITSKYELVLPRQRDAGRRAQRRGDHHGDRLGPEDGDRAVHHRGARRTITAGGTTKISGVLTAGTKPLAHRLVFLCRYDPDHQEVGQGRGQPHRPEGGVVFFVREPSSTATFELVFPGGPRFAGSHSGTVTVTVAGQPGGTTPAPTGGTRLPPAPRRTWHDPDVMWPAWPVSRPSALTGQAA